MNLRSLGSGPSGDNQTPPHPDGRVGRNRTCIGRVSDASPAVEGQPLGRSAGSRTLTGRLRGGCTATMLQTFVPLVAGPGIEPGAGAYEASVLPIHHPAMGLPAWSRTRDLPFTRGVLYLLSYGSIGARGIGSNSRPPAWKAGALPAELRGHCKRPEPRIAWHKGRDSNPHLAVNSRTSYRWTTQVWRFVRVSSP